MSNALAIGAATATLRQLLERSVKSEAAIGVTTFPPDLAKTFNSADEDGRLNLFLYHTQPNAAWRNLDNPQQIKRGEIGQPALGLDLYYLITAYERDAAPSSIVPHRLLGRAMSMLHDHGLLGSEEIRNAFPGSELENQIERVRITPHALSVEELSKLWVIFQSEYRISAAYQVSVVLIESSRATKAALPVLRRGQNDHGVSAQAGLIPPFPHLSEVELPVPQRTAGLGTVLTLKGHHLDGLVTVEASHSRLTIPLALTVGPEAIDSRISTAIPNDAAVAPAGFYLVKVNVQRPGESFVRSTNELPFPLAPRIINPPIGVARNPDDVTLTLDCEPNVLPDQRVVLLLGDREVTSPTLTAPSTLTFTADTRAQPIAAGKYFVRLRVDGVDSELVTFQGQPPRPVFDPTLEITIPA